MFRRSSFRAFIHVFALFLCVLLGIAIGLQFKLDDESDERTPSLKLVRSSGPKQTEPCSQETGSASTFPRWAKVEPLNMADLLSKCPNIPVDPVKSLEKAIDDAMAVHKCRKPLTAQEFICTAQCPEREPELERTVRILRTGNHSAEWLIEACRRKITPVLIWVNTEGVVRYMYCVRNKVIVGPNLWHEAEKFLVMLSCVVRLAPKRDFLIGFDASDYTTPTWDAPYDVTHYINFQPGILRFVGTQAHNPLLFPTTSHLVATGFCNFRSGDKFWRFCYDSDKRRLTPYNERERVLMWRGLPTGSAWTPAHWTLMQRLALVRDFANKPGFDVGFVRKVKRFANSSDLLYRMVQEVWAEKPKIDKEDHSKYAFLLHVDGNTASWGISHKLMSGSTLVWVESQNDFREHFYHMLKPWEHYVPVAIDFSDLDAVKDWLFQNPDKAEVIAKNAKRLGESRMKPSDTMCYVYRLLASIAAAQQPAMDPREQALDADILRQMMGETMFAQFVVPSVYNSIERGMASVYSGTIEST